MKRQWMPLYVDDYLAETIRLSTIEHGAYLLLIMEYWHHGSLPHDPSQLARIARLPIAEWEAIQPTIEALFLPGWKHKRVEKELAEAQAAYDRRAAAGQKGGIAKARNQNDESIAPSNAAAMPQQEDVALLSQAQPLSQQLSSLRSDSAAARADDLEFRMAVMAAFREVGSQAFPNPTVDVIRWLKAGYDPELCVAVIRQKLAADPTIHSLRYFDGPIADAHAVPRGTAKSTGPPRSGKRDPMMQVIETRIRESHERNSNPTVIDGSFTAS